MYTDKGDDSQHNFFLLIPCIFSSFIIGPSQQKIRAFVLGSSLSGKIEGAVSGGSKIWPPGIHYFHALTSLMEGESSDEQGIFARDGSPRTWSFFRILSTLDHHNFFYLIRTAGVPTKRGVGVYT